MKTSIGVSVHLDREDPAISSHTLTRHSPSDQYVEVLDLGERSASNYVSVFINTREQAERLYQAVYDLTMRWRDRQPHQFKVDAVISDPLNVYQNPHDDCDIDGPHQHPGERAVPRLRDVDVEGGESIYDAVRRAWGDGFMPVVHGSGVRHPAREEGMVGWVTLRGSERFAVVPLPKVDES